MRMCRFDRSVRVLLGAALLGVSTVSCSESNPVIPSPGADNVPVVIESYVGTIPVSGSGFYSFSTTQAGNIMLTSSTKIEIGASQAVAMRSLLRPDLGSGVWLVFSSVSRYFQAKK